MSFRQSVSSMMTPSSSRGASHLESAVAVALARAKQAEADQLAGKTPINKPSSTGVSSSINRRMRHNSVTSHARLQVLPTLAPATVYAPLGRFKVG